MAENEACIDYEEGVDYHHFFVRPYGNAELIKELTNHNLGQVGVSVNHEEWNVLLEVTIRKP